MNILPSSATGPLPPSPQQGPAEVLPVRRLENPGERPSPYRGPQGSVKEQDEATERLQRAVEPDRHLSRRGLRAVSAYTSHAQDEERQYMRQVLGFEFKI